MLLSLTTGVESGGSARVHCCPLCVAVTRFLTSESPPTPSGNRSQPGHPERRPSRPAHDDWGAGTVFAAGEVVLFDALGDRLAGSLWGPHVQTVEDSTVAEEVGLLGVSIRTLTVNLRGQSHSSGLTRLREGLPLLEHAPEARRCARRSLQALVAVGADPNVTGDVRTRRGPDAGRGRILRLEDTGAGRLFEGVSEGF